MRVVCWLAVAAFLANAAAADPIVLSSNITEVTVFADRAEVHRVAKRAVTAGENVLTFKGLPDRIDPNSIQVSGKGEAILQDIRFERRHAAEATSERIRELDKALQQLADSMAAIDGEMRRARSEMTFVQNIADGLTRSSSKETPIELDPAKWTQMVAFYRKKLDALDKQVRSAEMSKRALQAEIDRTQRERSEIGGGAKVSNDVDVTVAARRPGNITLELSYLVAGPSWTPLYDIRVSSNTKKMSITYKARVRQATSEKWRNVKLKLSTANPQRGGSHPELSPWRLTFRSPAYGRNRGEASRRMAPAPRQMMNAMPAEEMAEFAAEPPPSPMSVATAQVRSGATSVVFVPEATSTITNDNQPSTVAVTVMDLPAVFRYSTVPKLSSHAYLKAKAKNNTEYPLLAGPANVFFDDAFVASSDLALVAPGQEFWTFLGIDEGIGVDYKLVRRFEEDIGKKHRVTYEYLTTIRNNKKTQEELVMWDQVPLSTNEDISVELKEPTIEEDVPTIKRDENGYIEWLLDLEPGKKVTVPFSFSVRYPRDREVDGVN